MGTDKIVIISAWIHLPGADTYPTSLLTCLFPPPQNHSSPRSLHPQLPTRPKQFQPSSSLSLTKPNLEIRLPPHDMQLAPTFPIQVLVHELQIVPPEHLCQYQVDLHYREAGKLASLRQRVISLQNGIGEKALISVFCFCLRNCFGLSEEMKDEKTLMRKSLTCGPDSLSGPARTADSLP